MSQKMSIALGSTEDAAKDFIEAWYCAERG
jgi:hypothetical protein